MAEFKESGNNSKIYRSAASLTSAAAVNGEGVDLGNTALNIAVR